MSTLSFEPCPTLSTADAGVMAAFTELTEGLQAGLDTQNAQPLFDRLRGAGNLLDQDQETNLRSSGQGS